MRFRDEVDPKKGSGRLSSVGERELRELDDPAHPRRSLSPETELELVDERVALAGDDERHRCRDKPHTAADPDDPVCDDMGRLVDIERDTPAIGVGLGPSARDFFDGLPELDDLTTGIDDSADFDLFGDDLSDLGAL